MRRLVLIRHGESKWNAERRIQGQSCAGLSDRGQAQAVVLAEHVHTRFAPVRLVSSDLQRAMQTASTLVAALDVTVEVDVTLRERSFGLWEGRLVDEVAAEDPDQWQRWRAGEDLIAEIGGESSQTLRERVVPTLTSYLDAMADGAVTIIVAHGGTIWHGVHGIFDLRRPTLGGVANVSMTTIGSVGEHRWLEAWNVDAFVPEALRSTGQIRPSRTAATPPPVGT